MSERTTKLKAYLGTTFSYGRYCFVSPTMTLYMTTFSPTPPATIGYNYPGKQYHLIFQKHKNATETGRQLVNNFEYIAIIFNKKSCNIYPRSIMVLLDLKHILFFPIILNIWESILMSSKQLLRANPFSMTFHVQH